MTIPVEPPHRSPRWRRALVMAGAGLVVVGIAVGSWWSERDPPDPDPTPTVDRGVITGEQATALVYLDWTRNRQIAECFTAADFPREPYLSSEIDRVPLVADYLQVEPATTDPSLPTPDLRWASTHGPGDPDSPPSRRLSDEEVEGGCLPGAPALRMPEQTETASLVEQARDDSPFLTALAEYAWAAQNPGPVQLATARIGDPAAVTTDDLDAQAAWAALVNEVVEELGTEIIVTVVESTDQYGQAGGVTREGTGVVVRVSAPGFDLSETWATHERTQCGEVFVDVASSDTQGARLIGGREMSNACMMLRDEATVPALSVSPAPAG